MGRPGNLTAVLAALAASVTPIAARGQSLNQNGYDCAGGPRSEPLQTAIRACSRLIDDRSTTPGQKETAYYNRAAAYKADGDLTRAIADYGSALNLNPGDAEVLNNRGTAYSAQGDYPRAIADFDAALKIDPSDVMALSNRGLSYRLSGDVLHAAADFDAALRLKPDDAEIKGRRDALAAEGGAENPLERLDRTIAANPKNAAAYLERGHLLGDIGNVTRAKADLDAAI
ncbi:MAG: hypothetical protein JWM33_2506, partial [Caulobacteraceae bacterium]|nr:hypothetical protein [Caulobacteraceae bacterium]